jgi:hypothetical protein
VHAGGKPSVVRRRRSLEQLEFRPPVTAAVLERMRVLSDAHDGWINFLPGVPEEEVEPPSRGIFSTLFGSVQAPVSMCTWVPAGRGRTGSGEQTVGVLHPRGRYAVAQLGRLGVPVPSGWRVGQDHARRGLIVHPGPAVPPPDVLEWMLRAGAALTAVPLTGTWQAHVYLPRQALVR